MTQSPERCGECGKEKCSNYEKEHFHGGTCFAFNTNACHGHQAEKDQCKDCGGPTSAGVFTDSERICQASCKPEEGEKFNVKVFNAKPKSEEGGWIDEFNKIYCDIHPGDSGVGGSDPQEPVYAINAEPEEVIAFIAKVEQAALLRGREEMRSARREAILKDDQMGRGGLGDCECKAIAIAAFDAATNSIDEKRG